MLRIACLGIVLVWVGSTARAEPPPDPPRLGILVGLGARQAWLRPEFGSSEEQTLVGVTTTSALRLTSCLGLGVHVGGARSTGHLYNAGTVRNWDDHNWSVLALDLAVAAQCQLGRFIVSPWLGRHFSRRRAEDSYCIFLTLPSTTPTCMNSRATEWTSDFMSYGITASFAVFPDFPLALFLDVQSGSRGAVLGPESKPRYDYKAATFGVAYRL
ncbi:MAG TPA: hypothetical protein VIX73_37200 [Kofleriaceae bacterium]|jgi:hypothetical protein